MSLLVEWHKDWTWIEFTVDGEEVFGYLNTLICDGGYWRADDTWVAFPPHIQKWLEELDAKQEEEPCS